MQIDAGIPDFVAKLNSRFLVNILCRRLLHNLYPVLGYLLLVYLYLLPGISFGTHTIVSIPLRGIDYHTTKWAVIRFLENMRNFSIQEQ